MAVGIARRACARDGGLKWPPSPFFEKLHYTCDPPKDTGAAAAAKAAPPRRRRIQTKYEDQ